MAFGPYFELFQVLSQGLADSYPVIVMPTKQEEHKEGEESERESERQIQRQREKERKEEKMERGQA